jgi:DNA-binding NarL/FixJ family response regulator
MEKLFTLTLEEIEYKISRLTDGQREILFHLARGKSDHEVAAVLFIPVARMRSRLSNAWDRVGFSRKEPLIALYAIWTYSRGART